MKPIINQLERIELVEKVGSGIKRMRDAMKEANLEEPKFEMGGFFTVVLYRPVVFEKWLEGWSFQFSFSILQYIPGYGSNHSLGIILSKIIRTICKRS